MRFSSAFRPKLTSHFLTVTQCLQRYLAFSFLSPMQSFMEGSPNTMVPTDIFPDTHQVLLENGQGQMDLLPSKIFDCPVKI